MLWFLESVDKDELQNKKALAAIQESVIGFTGSLENKTFLHEGALIELDPESYRPICRVYFFLLNDLLIVGKVKHDKYVYNLQFFVEKIPSILVHGFFSKGDWNMLLNTMLRKSVSLTLKTWMA